MDDPSEAAPAAGAAPLGERIFAAPFARHQVEVPEWGVTLHVRGMTAGERTRWEAMALRRQDGADLEIRVPPVAWCAVDATGNRIFSDDDIPRLAGREAAAINRLCEAILGLSGMDVRAEDAEKN